MSTFAQSRISLLEWTVGWLDRQSQRRSPVSAKAAHLTTGLRGEDAAYFYLRRMGYIIVARRWQSSRQRGDIDLIGWDGDCLCFIEVKTRTSQNFLPAEAAVNQEKRRRMFSLAQEYILRMESSERISTRFDVVSVYFTSVKPEFELFRGAFGS